jgi:hypothetical protein
MDEKKGLSFEEIRKLSQEDWKAYLKTLSLEEMFQLAEEGLDTVVKEIDEISDKLELNFEKKLETDQASRTEMEALLDRIKK